MHLALLPRCRTAPSRQRCLCRPARLQPSHLQPCTRVGSRAPVLFIYQWSTLPGLQGEGEAQMVRGGGRVQAYLESHVPLLHMVGPLRIAVHGSDHMHSRDMWLKMRWTGSKPEGGRTLWPARGGGRTPQPAACWQPSPAAPMNERGRGLPHMPGVLTL